MIYIYISIKQVLGQVWVEMRFLLCNCGDGCAAENEQALNKPQS